MEYNDIIESRDKLRDKLEQDIKDNKRKSEQIGKIVFYKDFELINKTKEHIGLIENEVFVVTRNIYDEKDEKIQLYEIYDENQVLLAKTDKDGKLTYEENYKKKLKDHFGKFYEESDIENRESYLIRKSEFVISEKPYEKLNDKEKEIIGEKQKDQKNKKVDESEMDVPEIARKDLKYDEDDILYSVEIKDKRFYNGVPSAKKYDGNAMLIYSKKEGRFLIGGMVNGHFEKSEYIDSSKSTTKTSIDFDRDGNSVERDNIHGIMMVKNNPDFAYSIDIEATGYIEFQELRVDRTKNPPQYATADLETTRQYRSSKEVEYLMRKDTNHYINDEIDDFNRKEELGEKPINIDELGDRTRESEEEEERTRGWR